MKAPRAFIVLALVGWACVTPPAGAVPLQDVLFLSDGTSVAGVIMAEEPGRSVTLETESGELLEYRFRDIQRIEKRLLDQQPLIENRDVVYLSDGVIFRGMIVGRVPDREITLELENGRLLALPMSQVVKIGKEQVAAGVVRKGPLKPKAAEKARVEFQLRIALDQLEARKQGRRPGAEAPGADLQEEIDRLEQEVQRLKTQQVEVDREAAEEDARFAAIESELGELRSQVLGTAGEIQGRIEACASPEVKRQLLVAYRDLGQSLDEILQRAELIALIQQPDPRIQQIELQEKAASAAAISQARLWKHPRYAEQWQALLAELPYEQRREIYREQKSTGAVGRALGNAIPFGSFLGSWRQQDPAAAVTAGLIVGGLGVLIYNETAFDAGDPEYDRLGGLGIGLVVGAWGFGIIEPFFHVTAQNAKLRDALELDPGAIRSTAGRDAPPPTGYAFPSSPPKPRVGLHLVRYEY